MTTLLHTQSQHQLDHDHKDVDEKLETQQLEHEDRPATDGPLVSHYADMERGPLIRRFWRLFLIGVGVASAGMQVSISAHSITESHLQDVNVLTISYSGYTTTIPGSIVGNKGFIAQFATVTVKGQPALDANYVGLWNAVNYVFQAVAQFGSPFIAERFGIRINMYIFTCFKLLTIIIEIFCKNWWQFMLAKITNGLAAGLIGTSVLSYASEIALPQMRGTILSAYAFFFALGQLACAIGLDIINRTTPYAFRTAFYSQFVFLGLWLPILAFLPESPVWLYKRGNVEKSKRARRRLIGNVSGFDEAHEFAVFAQDIDRSVAMAAASSKYSMLACLKGTNLRRTIVSTLPISIQNFVGVPLMFNAVYFFSLIGLKNTFTANLIIYCVLLGGVLVSFYLVDKVGRRPLLLGGVAFMSVCVFAVGGIGFTTLTDSAGNALVAICALWVAAYSISVAPIGWVSLVEISTPQLRVQTAGLAALIQSCVNVLFSYTVPLMLSAQYAGWGTKIGLFFGPLAALSCLILFFFFPECKGRTYGELDELFERRVPAWKFSKTQTAVGAVREQEQAGRV